MRWRKRREAPRGRPDEWTRACAALREAERRLALAPEEELKEAARDWQRARRRVDRASAARSAADPPEGPMVAWTLGVLLRVQEGTEFVSSLLPRRRRR